MVFAIILAGGEGSRMNSTVTKQRMTLLGASVLRRSVLAFESCLDIDGIVVVSREGELEFAERELSDVSKLRAIVAGGRTRAESSYNGLCAVDSDCTLVAIHDAARCLIAPEDITRIVKRARECGAATAATAVTDTVKRVSDGFITETVPRGDIVAVQTPQIFDFVRLFDAFSGIDLGDASITDDNMVYERAGHTVATVLVGSENIKITNPRDFLLAELILKEREK